MSAQTVSIGGRMVGEGQPCYLVAEIGINHNGDIDLAKRGINVPMAYTEAYTCFGLGCVVAARIPNNAGSLEPLTVSAPGDTILNAPKPSAVASRHVIGQMLPDIVFGCLQQARPQQVPAEGTSSLWNVRLAGGQPFKGVEPEQLKGKKRFNVVGFNTGSWTELLPKVGHGLLVPTGDVGALATAVATASRGADVFAAPPFPWKARIDRDRKAVLDLVRELVQPYQNMAEARFALADQDSVVRPLALELFRRARCRHLILKLGERGVLGRQGGEHDDVDALVDLLRAGLGRVLQIKRQILWRCGCVGEAGIRILGHHPRHRHSARGEVREARWVHGSR